MKTFLLSAILGGLALGFATHSISGGIAGAAIAGIFGSLLGIVCREA